MDEQVLGELYASLKERHRPEHVLRLVLEADPQGFTDRDRRRLRRIVDAARSWSSMPTSFDEAVPPLRQVAKGRELFPDVAPPAAADDPEELEQYCSRLLAALHAPGVDFLRDRPARAVRRTDLPAYTGHRAYNKRFRFVARLRRKLDTWARVRRQRRLAQRAKTLLAAEIAWPAFSADPTAAVFIAYYAARLGRRSEFTWGSQDRAFDEVSELLLSRVASTSPAWGTISLVLPTPATLDRLSEEQKGVLLARWFEVMTEAAEVLGTLAAADPNLDLETLVVRRGNDSSTWNEAAGAFNKARDAWIGLILSLGLGEMLDAVLPGKALRLMAADVVWMHRAYGKGDLDPDTRVWQALPRPWDVLRGEATCTRTDVKQACEQFGVKGRGWLQPRPKTVVATRPTPELVHGVRVTSPGFAVLLKRLGSFGGETKRRHGVPEIPVARRVEGTTLTAAPVSAAFAGDAPDE